LYQGILSMTVITGVPHISLDFITVNVFEIQF